jgi:ferredoxin
MEEGDPLYYIDPDRCTECVGVYDEPACIAVCPVECIVLDKDNVETIAELQYKYKAILAEEE